MAQLLIKGTKVAEVVGDTTSLIANTLYHPSGTQIITDDGGTIGLTNVNLQNINFDNVANNAISGDKIHGGTISGSQLHTDVTFADVNSSIANDSISGDKIHGGTISGSELDSSVSFPSFVGMIASFAMSSAPTGWIVCNGAEYAIADYGDLYTAIGTTWGALTNGSGGAGSTHFRVPDLRGAFLRGIGTGTINGRNKVAGPVIGAMQEDQFQGHGHNMRIYYGTAAYGPRYGDNQSFTNTVPIREPVELNNGPVRYGDETYPYNATVEYCIKY